MSNRLEQTDPFGTKPKRREPKPPTTKPKRPTPKPKRPTIKPKRPTIKKINWWRVGGRTIHVVALGSSIYGYIRANSR